MEMLRIEGLYKSFGDKKVLNGLDLTVPEHSIFGFVGKNGAGKTTTMKTVLGLLKADQGKIFVNSEEVIYGKSATNRHIGYLPDVPEFYSFMSAPEYLRFCIGISRVECENVQSRIDELLEMVGLLGENHRIKGFSRGMKQRLGIAQALICKPKLLICDEPTSALDPAGRKELLDILLSIKDQTTVLFSTHILSDVERICTNVAFLESGVIRLEGTIDDVKKSFRSEEYLVEFSSPEDALFTLEAFKGARRITPTRIIFGEEGHSLFDLYVLLAQKHIKVSKIERVEPTLESLFLEVTKK